MTVLEKVKGVLRRRPRQLELEEYLEKMAAKGFDKNGNLIMDPTPIAPPIGYKKHPSMVEIVRDMVKSERLAQEALASGHETFEEAEDFEIDDEPEQLRSKWENDFEPSLKELTKAGEAELKKKGPKAPPPADGPPIAPKEPEDPPADGPPTPPAPKK